MSKELVERLRTEEREILAALTGRSHDWSREDRQLLFEYEARRTAIFANLFDALEAAKQEREVLENGLEAHTILAQAAEAEATALRERCEALEAAGRERDHYRTLLVAIIEAHREGDDYEAEIYRAEDVLIAGGAIAAARLDAMTEREEVERE